MNEIDFTNMVLATTTSGEKMVGTFVDRDEFEKDAKMGVATILKNVRNMTLQEMQQQTPDGQVMVGMSVILMALPPFTFPVPAQHVRLSGWIYLGDNEDLHPTLRSLLIQAERRETEMRASSAGIELVGGRNTPPNLRG